MNRYKIVLITLEIMLFSATLQMAQIKDSDYNIINYSKTIDDGTDLSKRVLDNGEKRIIAELTLRNGKATGAHTEDIPFMVYGIAGTGELILGDNEKVISIEPGVLVTVESGIAHNVVAKPSLSILVIKLVGDTEMKESNEKHNEHGKH